MKGCKFRPATLIGIGLSALCQSTQAFTGLIGKTPGEPGATYDEITQVKKHRILLDSLWNTQREGWRRNFDNIL
jgi:hypothetical protein